MATTIPRFLLPQRGLIWRSRVPSSSGPCQRRRYASSSSKPRVLEKPTKFTPPSHGSKLRKAGPRYPGPDLSQEELHTQKTKNYPHMMPAEGTFLHWFLTNRGIHVWITLGTLFSLATFTFITNFRQTSKFGDMLPPASDLFYHPVAFTRSCMDILKLHTAAVSAETAQRRQRSMDDVAKRGTFRKAHGLETDSFGGWTAKDETPVVESDETIGADGQTSAGAVANADDGGLQEHTRNQQRERRPIKKWFGIW
ncbi:MAG: hypothetical protein M1818_005391 [Claussenomyces sp. TS43310]|nr:MAG: hypothetical protein M1818_005391 [Claussenomyces sp. TS43310]